MPILQIKTLRCKKIKHLVVELHGGQRGPCGHLGGRWRKLLSRAALLLYSCLSG